MQILRVSRRWELALRRELADARGRGRRLRAARARVGAIWREHAARLAEVGRRGRRCSCIVSLREPERDVASYVSRARRAASARAGCSGCDARAPCASGGCSRAPSSSGRACAPTRCTRGSPTSCRCGRRAASSCSGSSAARSAAALGEPAVDGLHEPRALSFERNGEAVLAPLEGDVLRWVDGLRRARGRVAARSSPSSGRAGRRSSCSGAARARARSRAPRAELMFAPAGKPAVRRRPHAERALPAERAGAADRAAPDPGRRPDPARRVRRRAGGVRPRLRAHPGGARPARLPAGLEPAAAAARDARDRRRRRATRRSSRSAWRCAGAPTARSACTARSATSSQLFLQHLPGAAHARRGLRRHAHDRAGRGDDADRDARGGLARAASTSATRSRARASRCCFNLREGSDSDRNTTILSVGALGSGKTTLAQKLTVRGRSCRARG